MPFGLGWSGGQILCGRNFENYILGIDNSSQTYGQKNETTYKFRWKKYVLIHPLSSTIKIMIISVVYMFVSLKITHAHI